jgi:hypothetical protein
MKSDSGTRVFRADQSGPHPLYPPCHRFQRDVFSSDGPAGDLRKSDMPFALQTACSRDPQNGQVIQPLEKTCFEEGYRECKKQLPPSIRVFIGE